MLKNRTPMNVVKEAFMNTPVVLTPFMSRIIEEDMWFIPNSHYAKKYEDQMIDGEIGVLNSLVGPRRIIIDKYVKA